MGHGGDIITMTQSIGKASVIRHNTVPLSKPESVTSPMNKISFFSSGTNGSVQHKTGKSVAQINSHPQMVAGKKRSPKEIKRTNSYKLALNRQSAQDDLDKDENARHSKADLDSETTKCSVVSISRGEERKKYNTLPIKPGTSFSSSQVLVNSGDAKSETTHYKSKTFTRNWSQKSGTYPSPDTDEDQASMLSSRKKKSGFKRFKERLIESFRRDRDHVKDSRKLKKHDSAKNHKFPTHKVKPGNSEPSAAYLTPEDGIEEIGHTHGRQADDRTRVHDGEPGAEMLSGGPSGDSGPKGEKSPSLLKRFRNSFRRQKKDKPKQPEKKFELHQIHQESLAPQLKTPKPENSHPSLEDLTLETDDITDVFENIIESVPFRKPDRSKLRLEGLVKCKPASFDKPSPVGRRWFGEICDGALTPNVETDGGGGHDVTDGPTLPMGGSDGIIEDESDGEIADDNDKHRVCNDIADRLKAIGDSIVSKRQSESELDVESFRPGRRRSSLDLFLIEELRKCADDNPLFKSAEAQPSVSVLPFILPAIKSLIRAPTYDEFKQAVTRELVDTIGWEQVAWYTYLVQTSMLVVKGGKWAGQSFRQYATRYFRSSIRPWINSRPNGWESIYEETDVDTELD